MVEEKILRWQDETGDRNCLKFFIPKFAFEELHLFFFFRLLRDKPGASINSVIGRWAGLYDDESCECIYQLANRELLTTQDESRQLFIDTLKRLKQRCEAIAEKQLIEKLSKHPQLDDETLNKLNELLLKRKPS